MTWRGSKKCGGRDDVTLSCVVCHFSGAPTGLKCPRWEECRVTTALPKHIVLPRVTCVRVTILIVVFYYSEVKKMVSVDVVEGGFSGGVGRKV